MLSLRNVTMAFGGPPLLDRASFEMAPRERVCLVGRNGTGKSTLLKIIACELQPDGGEVSLDPAAFASFLPQEVPLDFSGTVAQIVKSRFTHTHLPDWETDTAIEKTLHALNLDPGADAASLSAGLKRRVLFASAVAPAPDLLILDEPTNHLDIESIQYIEDFLTTRFRSALLFVTHDRAFLQKVATRILDLDRGRLTSWNCRYEQYLQFKEEALQNEVREQREFDKKLAAEEIWIRKGIQARRTRNEGRVRALLKMREERRSRREQSGNARIAISDAERSGEKVIAVENLSYSWDRKPLIQSFSCLISRGDKIGIVGPNGAGKTTLLQLLLQRLEPREGTVQHGTNLKIAWFDQLREQLDPAQQVFEAVADGNEKVTVGGRELHVMSYLGDFLFPPDRARSTVGMLSGGERNRLLLCRLFARPANLLVLDEPTNDLDLETLDLLEEKLVAYSGTVLLVSHDRRFLDNVVTNLFVLNGTGDVDNFIGGYSDFLRQQEKKILAPSQNITPAKKKKPPRERKFLNRERWELERLPEEIEQLENEQAQLVEDLANPNSYSQNDNPREAIEIRMAEIEILLEKKMERWEELETLRHRLEADTP